MNLGMFWEQKAMMSEIIRMEGPWRVDIGVPGQVLFEDIVLDRPHELVMTDPLLFTAATI